MAKRTVNKPEVIEARIFSLKDIELGIKKLQRRTEEMIALTGIHWEDQSVDNVVSNIKQTISEIFGEQSREMNEHRYLSIWKGPRLMGMNDRAIQSSFSEGIPETQKLIEGLIARLKEKKDDLSADEPAQYSSLFNGLSIHTKIYDVSEALFRDGHYANAVFEASKVLVGMVKDKMGPSSNKDGTGLMFAVFGGTEPAIRFNELSSQAEIDEQSGFTQLFAGAVLALRNPRGHDYWVDSPERALEYISFLSMLAKKLDEAKKV